MRVTSMDLRHGESETRFVATFKHIYVPKMLPSSSREKKLSTVILSNDSDVTIILCLTKSMHNHTVLHVLSNRVIDIDMLISKLYKFGEN